MYRRSLNPAHIETDFRYARTDKATPKPGMQLRQPALTTLSGFDPNIVIRKLPQ